MARYLRLLALHGWLVLADWLATRLRRCPVCWTPTVEHHVTMSGGLFACRLCTHCFGLFGFVNITPERIPEELAVDHLPF